MLDQTYISVCDGIGAIHCAAQPLGWRCKWTSEIERFPAAVVEHHWQLPNLGDMLAITEKDIDEHGRARLLVGGTPCQSFSIAGLRGGLDDPRGNLALRFVQLADVIRPQWVLWENVPGVLSSGGGRDFGSIVGALAKLGYGWAYRILDAQFFGVPQRRRRVFLVGCLGDWRRAAAVLFERHSLQGHPAPRREAREDVTATIAGGARKRGGYSSDDIPAVAMAFAQNTRDEVRYIGGNGQQVGALAANAGMKQQNYLQVANAEGSTGLPFLTKSNVGKGVNNQPPLAYTLRGDTLAASLAARHDGSPCVDRGPDVVKHRHAVRRLTPRECERLQGFPDDYTLIQYGKKPAADGPRYKALGNSMAVPVMRWIMQRIGMVDQLTAQSSKDAA